MKRAAASVVNKNELIEDYSKRINLKCKRKKTLMKKIIEFSKMIGMQIYMVIHDQDQDKVLEFTSGTRQTGYFT